MLALCAVRVSWLSCGMAMASICWLSPPTLVCCSTATLVIFLPATVIWTCIGPYWVFATAPVITRAAVDWPVPPVPPVPPLVPVPPLGVAVWDGAAVAVAEGLAAIDGFAVADD